MPHADSSLVPQRITNKTEFWDHVYVQLQNLLAGERNWVSNCANSASLIYNSLLAFPTHFGESKEKAVNWCGVYVERSYFPKPKNSSSDESGQQGSHLLLGPFNGKPACQFINVEPTRARGVCADAFLNRKTLLVPNVDEYPGHIACDGETKSEIVIPLILESGEAVGVLDLDCLALNGFNSRDQEGLEKIARFVMESSDW